MKNINVIYVKTFCLTAFTAAAAAGCRSYEASPIDWKAEVRSGVTNVIRISSLEDAAELALVGNRELNAMRLKAGGSAKVAKATGWWEDPELDFDFVRIVNPSDNPFLGGGSIAFTIPLSGALALDERRPRPTPRRTRRISARRNRMSPPRPESQLFGSMRSEDAAGCWLTGAGTSARRERAETSSVCMTRGR